MVKGLMKMVILILQIAVIFFGVASILLLLSAIVTYNIIASIWMALLVFVSYILLTTLENWKEKLGRGRRVAPHFENDTSTPEEHKSNPKGKKQRLEEKRENLDKQKEKLMADMIIKAGGMVAMGMDRNTISFYIMTEVGDAPGWSRFDRIMFAGMLEKALDNMNISHTKSTGSMKQEDLMNEIMFKVSGMVAMGLDRDTISYYLMTEIGGASKWKAVDKVRFAGMIENALDKMNVRR